MAARVLFVTGTDTGVGKTVLAAALVRGLRRSGVRAVGLKPLCSGGREDAEALWAAAEGALPLDAVNPWHFPAAVTPQLAARRRGRRVTREAVLGAIRRAGRAFATVVIEGAGGLLSPLGEDFDSRDLIRALRAEPILVVPNRLGALNQTLLVWEALPPARRRLARVALRDTAPPDPVARSNAQWLRARLGSGRVFRLPWWPHPDTAAARSPAVRRLLRALRSGETALSGGKHS